MKFTKFIIKNFKGIENITFDLDKSPDAKIYTLIGLNESGKTTILEAINFFNADYKGLSLDLPGAIIKDYNSLIPINQRDNFNDVITLEVTLELEEDDLEKINEFIKVNTPFSKVKPVNSIEYFRRYKFKDSKYMNLDFTWSGFNGLLKEGSNKKYISMSSNAYIEVNNKLATFCRELIPSILYFPNFLFDFPSKIYLKTKDEPTTKEEFYIELIQDILYSLDNKTNIQTHLIDRIKSNDPNDKRNLDSLLQKMSRKVTAVVFDAWNRMFKKKFADTKIIIKYDIDTNGLPYLEFEIEAEDGIYQINERSLGFRWFFTFLLFTQFRPHRKGTPQNIIYLFDEPASNLHSSAQKLLLKSFENLGSNAKIIYTTHSHHLINPHWLESTYVVKNGGINPDNFDDYSSRKTNITIESYRDFVLRHPHNTAYFQPVLDVLEYMPSNLENLPNCIFLEGKNDFYTLAYFKDIILDYPEKLNLAPGGSGNLDSLISLYIAWGKEFVILLDSDEAGHKAKDRYIKKFGIILEKRLFTLQDIDKNWANKELEQVFDKDDLLNFQLTCYPDSLTYNKTHFNRSIQESLINQRDYQFSTITKDSIKKVLDFLEEKISSSKN